MQNSMKGEIILLVLGSEEWIKGKKKGELPRLKCFHNGIILIVNCFKLYLQ